MTTTRFHAEVSALALCGGIAATRRARRAAHLDVLRKIRSE
jgi:hypothetical protein